MRERSQTEAYHVLKVAASLTKLPLTASAFEKGAISWSQFKPIAEVANPSTEEKWISYAKAHTVRALEEAVKDALENGRDLPREEEHGLPNITVNLVLRLSRENHEILRKALEKVAAEVRASRGDEEARVTLEDSVLYLSRRVLATDLAGPGMKGSERERSIYDILYQVCPACRSSVILTGDGPVEVPREHVTKIEGDARKVEILTEELVKGEALPEGEIDDQEIPKDVEAKVLRRYGNSCARCGMRLGLHLHHVIFRQNGGPNEVWNLCSICRGCHSLVHGGALEVYLDSAGDLHWKSRADRIELVLKEEVEELSSVPPAVIVVEKKEEAPAKVKVEAKIEAQPAPSNGTAPMRRSRESEGAVEAIEKIGYGKKEARDLVLKALELLSGLGRAPTGDEIFNTALRGRAVVFGETFRTSGKFGPKPGEEGETPRKAFRNPEAS